MVDHMVEERPRPWGMLFALSTGLLVNYILFSALMA